MKVNVTGQFPINNFLALHEWEALMCRQVVHVQWNAHMLHFVISHAHKIWPDLVIKDDTLVLPEKVGLRVRVGSFDDLFIHLEALACALGIKYVSFRDIKKGEFVRFMCRLYCLIQSSSPKTLGQHVEKIIQQSHNEGRIVDPMWFDVGLQELLRCAWSRRWVWLRVRTYFYRWWKPVCERLYNPSHPNLAKMLRDLAVI